MSADAATLRCPNCGAPADPDARRCSFCQARLATISCPSCFGLMFRGAAYCPKCGVKAARSEPDDSRPANCPGCRTGLRALQIGATALLECEKCDGVWLDAAVFEQLCLDKESQAAVLHAFPATGAASVERVTYRPCVRCGKMMNRINFGKLSGVVVDVCKGHGTYLDPGELHRIVEFIRSGGLERARARQLEELRDREREVAEAEARQARERGRSEARSGDWPAWTFVIGD